MRFAAILLASVSALSACSGEAKAPEEAAKPKGSYGGAGGADMSIEAIEPKDEPVTVGKAGDDPSDIARYILASGASGVISPDGKLIAMNWRITGAPQLWVVPVEGGQPKQLTFGNGITFFRWTPDSKAILYGADNNGNEQESFNLVTADGAVEQELLAAKDGSFRAFGDFLPDGQSLLFSSPDRNGSDFDIYAASPEGPPQLIAEGNLGTFVQSVSPDGASAIVTEGVGEDSDKLMLLDIRGKKLATLAAPDPRANHNDGGFAWTPDSKGFYFATNEGREFAALAFHDIAVSKTTILHEDAFDIQNVSLCGAGGRWLAWTTNEDGFFKLQIQDLTTKKMIAAPALAEGTYGLNCGLGSSKLSINVNGWDTPGDIVVLDIATGKTTTAFKGTLAGLDPKRLVKPVSLRMKAQDGVELQGLLYLPDAASRKGAALPPVLFDVHGGPTAQSVASFDTVAQYYVDRGIAVFSPNVRGSTGLGRTYTTLDDGRKRLDSVRDLVDMLAFLKTDGRVDADRAAVSGGSYGGYMVNAVVGAYPEAFDAGISIFGVGNWVGALEIASPGLKASDKIEYGDIADPEWKKFYTENSPINNADKIKIPMLYAHGVMDPRIDISETEVMVKALRNNGIETTFIRLPDEGHGWRKLKNRLFYHRREAEFLEKHLAAK
ncbi:MAG: S9 family peptidase [Hyphomonadaceae bacterium]|nr:S9 family peptidase [Hyphomonadaceae bacterium]